MTLVWTENESCVFDDVDRIYKKKNLAPTSSHHLMYDMSTSLAFV